MTVLFLHSSENGTVYLGLMVLSCHSMFVIAYAARIIEYNVTVVLMLLYELCTDILSASRTLSCSRYI